MPLRLREKTKVSAVEARLYRSFAACAFGETAANIVAVLIGIRSRISSLCRGRRRFRGEHRHGLAVGGGVAARRRDEVGSGARRDIMEEVSADFVFELAGYHRRLCAADAEADGAHVGGPAD